METNNKKKRKFTAKRKERLFKKVIDSPAGSLLVMQKREEEAAASIPRSDKINTILDELRHKAIRLYDTQSELEDSKKFLIRRTANELADYLKESGQQQFISKICYTITQVLKPFKKFASDRYIREVLPEEYKDVDQRNRAISGGTGSADKKQTVEEFNKMIKNKKEYQEREKGIPDYTKEDIEKIDNILILREIALHHMQKSEYFQGEFNRLKATK